MHPVPKIRSARIMPSMEVGVGAVESSTNTSQSPGFRTLIPATNTNKKKLKTHISKPYSFPALILATNKTVKTYTRVWGWGGQNTRGQLGCASWALIPCTTAHYLISTAGPEAARGTRKSKKGGGRAPPPPPVWGCGVGGGGV